MKINCVITIMFLLGVIIETSSQVTFQKSYADQSGALTSAQSVIECTDNGFIFIGKGGVNYAGISIGKTDSTGNLQWSLNLEKAGFYNSPTKVLETYDGGYAILGTSATTSNADILLCKFDANGNRLWAKNYGDTGENYAYDFRLTNDSGFIVIGGCMTGSTYGTVLFRTNANGDTLWTKSYLDIKGESFCPMPDGGFLIGGGIGSKGLLMKIDSSGALQWNRIYQIFVSSRIIAIEPTGDSTYVLNFSCHDIQHNGAIGYFTILANVNSMGGNLWSQSFYSIPEINIKVNSGNIIVQDHAWWFFYLDKNGNFIWRKTLQGYLDNINLTHDNGFILCGGNQHASPHDSYLAKTDSLGNTACSSLPANIQLNAVTLTNISSQSINRFSANLPINNTSLDSVSYMVEHNICSSIGIDEYKSEKNVYVFPNPVTSKLFINWENRIGSVRISLYNIIGKTCLQKNVFNDSSSEIDVSTFEKGIYILSIDSKEQTVRTKVVIE